VSTRERILEVAEEIIARHGMEGLRLKDVAESVGIQPPSVFTHFDGREAIGDAVAHRVLEKIAAGVETGAFPPLPPGSFLPVLEGAIVASVGWSGFRVTDGCPAVDLTRDDVVARIEDLAWAYVRQESDARDARRD